MYFFLILNYPSFPLFLFFFLSFSFLLFSSFNFLIFFVFCFCVLSLSVIVLFLHVQINAIKKEGEEEECRKVRAGLYIGWSRVYFPKRCYLCAANGWDLARLARPCGNGGPVSIEEFTLIVASIFPYILILSNYRKCMRKSWFQSKN